MRAHVIVIGAGSTGAAIAYDLALRGLRVTLLERAGVAGGTTGHNQAQMHSGARYVVKDPEAARECALENKILRQIMPGELECNDGLFIATRPEHRAYLPVFLAACAACGVPARPISVGEALRLEPLLNPKLLAAVQILDGVFDPYRFCLRFLAGALQYGAQVRLFHPVTGIQAAAGRVTALDLQTGQETSFQADAIINAAGPWAGQVAGLAGAPLELEASAGVMVTVKARLCNMVINLLAPPADGDILVPQRHTTILGTTSWTVPDPDDVPVPLEHVQLLFDIGAEMIPAVRRAPVIGAMAAARPLLKTSAGGREATRGFACYDHTAQGAPGFFSIVGGKTTTARGMAEKMSDLVCAYLSHSAPCATAERVLPDYHSAYTWIQRGGQ